MKNMSTLHLEIVTPDRIVLSTDVDYIGAHGMDGDFGILPNHAALLSALSLGALHFDKDGKRQYCFVSGGFLEVAGSMVTILAESAELAEDIDTARAEAARKRAEDFINCVLCEGVDQARAARARSRADARLRIATAMK